MTDVLCVGQACFDLTFSVDKHPDSDEKLFASAMQCSGGGPAANAAIAVARLGLQSAFVGYLGNDLYGEQHRQEFNQEQVDVSRLVRGNHPTPLSTILVKPDGQRALINYKGETTPLAADVVNIEHLSAKAILFDGHQPFISETIAKTAQQLKIPTILDAGSVHQGTLKLLNQVDYLVASKKFAKQYAGNINTALNQLAQIAPVVVITLGEEGLIWQQGSDTGRLPAFSVEVVDTTGAGDAFHGAFAAAIALNKDLKDSLIYASAAGALCCGRLGARAGMPYQQAHQALYASA